MADKIEYYCGMSGCRRPIAQNPDSSDWYHTAQTWPLLKHLPIPMQEVVKSETPNAIPCCACEACRTGKKQWVIQSCSLYADYKNGDTLATLCQKGWEPYAVTPGPTYRTADAVHWVRRLV